LAVGEGESDQESPSGRNRLIRNIQLCRFKGDTMTTASALIDLTPNKHPEALAWRLREFQLAADPLVKAMVRLKSLAIPSYCVIVHSDGTQTDISKHDDGMTPEMRLQMQWLQDQHAALARSYGFGTPTDSSGNI
jgi:hypothetical protein